MNFPDKIESPGVRTRGYCAVDDLHDLVVHRGRNARLAAECADNAVYGIDLGQFPVLKVLKHTCLQTGVFLYRYGNYEEG